MANARDEKSCPSSKGQQGGRQRALNPLHALGESVHTFHFGNAGSYS